MKAMRWPYHSSDCGAVKAVRPPQLDGPSVEQTKAESRMNGLSSWYVMPPSSCRQLQEREDGVNHEVGRGVDDEAGGAETGSRA